MKGTMLAGVRWLLKHNNNSKKFGLNASSSVSGGISRSCYDCIPNIRTFSSSSSLVREGCDDGVGGYVMSFGDGNQGALGLPSSSMGIGAGGGGDAYEPTKITGLPSDDITCIGAGHYHSHGDVWSWGRNNEFQLGRDSFDVPRDSWSKPEMVQGLSQVRVKAVYASCFPLLLERMVPCGYVANQSEANSVLAKELPTLLYLPGLRHLLESTYMPVDQLLIY